MTAASRADPFTSAEALAALEEACLAAGLRHEGAELMRLGENAIFRLTHDRVVVRIARNLDVLDDAAKEVAVARWLRDADVPGTEPADYAQPIIARGRPVTFWKLIDDSGTKATTADLGAVLRCLHALPVPGSLHLPELDIFGRVGERIAGSADLAEADRSFLAGRLASLRTQYQDLRFGLPPSAVHGDAHQANLIKRPDGAVILIDFERFAFGHPETDLSVTATEYLIGWHTDEQYADFVRAYGYDVMDWDGFPVIRSINELKMTTWLMQNIGESARIADEFRTRLASLRDSDATRDWQAF
ncbi:MAG TPA: aminoglycoside phosphotransferase family protein [Streptosporangiaceae bacterium]|nr:aminoglycoside phosphotransferase family protein [Streptosporangiaceae bacterium]